MTPQFARDALAARDLWHGRKRRFDDDGEGFDYTDALLEQVIDLCGGSTDLACHLVFEAERIYWESRNHARGSRKPARTGSASAGPITTTTPSAAPGILSPPHRHLQALGFYLREHFHAGAHAGWAAQVLEHPTAGIVIFADLDLAAEEVSEDFAHKAARRPTRPNTVGLWVGLHGESILEAGMHHLEAQFDFDALRDDLESEAGVETMKPFSEFPFLRQAFTQGERWPVPPLAPTASSPRAGSTRNSTTGSSPRVPSAATSKTSTARRLQGLQPASRGAIIAATDPRLQRLGT